MKKPGFYKVLILVQKLSIFFMKLSKNMKNITLIYGKQFKFLANNPFWVMIKYDQITKIILVNVSLMASFTVFTQFFCSFSNLMKKKLRGGKNYFFKIQSTCNFWSKE